MKKDFKEILQTLKEKLQTAHDQAYYIMGWVLVILVSIILVAFLYRCFSALLGKEIITRQEWIGFVILLVLLGIGILTIIFFKREKPE
jgi:hypothetical protein